MTARDVMSNGIAYCRDDEETDEAVHIMEKRKIRRLPVINKNKRLVGLLGLGDVAAKSSESLTTEVLKAVSAHHK